MYKDKEAQREAARLRKQRQRSRLDVTPSDVTPSVKLMSRPNGPDYNPDETLPGGEKRYLGPFTDRQVLDRLSVPEPVLNHRQWQEITMSNRANEYRSVSTSPEITKRLKELMKQ